MCMLPVMIHRMLLRKVPQEAQADDPETVVCNMQAAMWSSSILICSSVLPNLVATSLYFEGGKS